MTERAEMPIVSDNFFFVTQCPKFMAVFVAVVVVLMLGKPNVILLPHLLLSAFYDYSDSTG